VGGLGGPGRGFFFFWCLGFLLPGGGLGLRIFIISSWDLSVGGRRVLNVVCVFFCHLLMMVGMVLGVAQLFHPDLPR